jgi:3-dehydroquinate dehydratase-2
MPEKSPHKKILVIHGPNLNMLGQREPEIYGNQTLDQINEQLLKLGQELGLMLETFQSNHEGELVTKIQHSAGSCDGVMINPAAYTHTSIALRDALSLLDIPVVEIHLSNINKRESFRHKSLIADIAAARIAGFGAQGYLLALQGLAELIE